MRDIIISELWEMDPFLEDIRSTNKGFRLLLVLISPIKYIIGMLFMIAVAAWAFSGFGLLIFIADIQDFGKLYIGSYLCIVVDLIWIYFYIREKVFNK